MLIYVVEYVTRDHCNGYENRKIATFSTLKASSQFIMKIFESFALDEEAEDLYVDSREHKHAPKPTMELAAQLFNPVALQAFLDKPKNDNIMYGPWSQYCILAPFEILLMESDVN
jgi:hypothetical protein